MNCVLEIVAYEQYNRDCELYSILWTLSCGPYTMNCRLWDYGLWTMGYELCRLWDYGLWTVDCGLWILGCALGTDCGLWIVDVDHGLQTGGLWTMNYGTMNYRLWTMDCELGTVDYG